MEKFSIKNVDKTKRKKVFEKINLIIGISLLLSLLVFNKYCNNNENKNVEDKKMTYELK